ncbi:restriction endonuclease [Myroides sp. DF42-4-2]|uniref:McrC family protein n=1 Tax=unclassified Myroides TaxID=2642485 RepID=UPI002575D4FD|nr:restriction endonuclease [Myroides sp. DF42-4-2]MDM1407038.1 restriction endonuclease [Myroides sp. DF42-4-2]
MNKENKITVFEHEKRVFDLNNTEEKLLHDALELYHGDGTPFFKLIRNGVQFNEHVGVIQVGKTTIEVLPKADQSGETKWRNLLIEMIKTVWRFDVKSTGSSSLKLKANSILELYFELFISEVEYLLHRGLIKRYRKQEGNQKALKGSLQFSKHLALNLVHKERFYVKYTHYSTEHILHEILFKTIQLLVTSNTNPALKGRIASLAMNFPEMKNCKITASTFGQLVFDRKNKPYEKAIEIAKLLLLNYHPDVVKGKNNVLALMFDMNNLWEKFILVTLKKGLTTHRVSAQLSKKFWQPNTGYSSTIRPDIVIQHNTSKEFIVLDTKWKNINDSNPSPEDLRQMYVYHRFYQANTVLLIYPSDQHQIRKGNYFNSASEGELSDKTCSIIQIATGDTIQTWQEEIVEKVEKIMN